jgi:hypothetical protein
MVFRKSTPPQNHQLIVYYIWLEQQVDGFVGDLTFERCAARRTSTASSKTRGKLRWFSHWEWAAYGGPLRVVLLRRSACHAISDPLSYTKLFSRCFAKVSSHINSSTYSLY